MATLFAVLLILICFPFSAEESQVLQIPLKRSIAKSTDAEVETVHTSEPNYNLHGMLGQGYYVELAVGQPEQLVNRIHIFTARSSYAIASTVLGIVILSVYLSDTRMLCDKTKENTADILIPRERVITVVF